MREMGVGKGDIKLKAGLFGAEPWSENMRRDIEKLWGIDALDIYGLSEIMGPGVANECLEKNGLHVFEDHFIPEIINSETGKAVAPGERGELVFTTITKEGIPLIRYRTKDITRIIPEKCKCGRTFTRIERLSGRTDDMLIIRGVNVFPSEIEKVIMSVEGVEPHYQIVVDRAEHGLDTLEVLVEVNDKIFSDEIKNLESIEKKIKKEINSVLGIGVTVKLVEPGSIPRSEGKAKRIIDKRKI
jgi:phenylacetate-CoA ligase